MCRARSKTRKDDVNRKTVLRMLPSLAPEFIEHPFSGVTLLKYKWLDVDDIGLCDNGAHYNALEAKLAMLHKSGFVHGLRVAARSLALCRES